ncbi:MAG: hypothetical protein MN733_40810 [Nitrososphaera sp.]|nr:hypothetical protein [Nitrososphaera sp.]
MSAENIAQAFTDSKDDPAKCDCNPPPRKADLHDIVYVLSDLLRARRKGWLMVSEEQKMTEIINVMLDKAVELSKDW